MVSPSLLVGFAPVVLFLAGLMLMDSYKLVSRRAVFAGLGAGCLAAGLSLAINVFALRVAGADPLVVKRYLAPLIEEVIKALYVLYLIRREKVGFMVDAGILGFAVGTGFALVENTYYASMGSTGLLLWMVRGLGTAIMHGSTTAIVAVIAKDMADRARAGLAKAALPGLMIAVSVHSLFNHVVLNPLLTTAILLVSMPLLMLFVFERSERSTRDWLGAGLDSDVELLEQLLGEEIASTQVGTYLESLKNHFPGPVVGDMLCLLRIHLELSLRAKGVLIARAAGVVVEPDEHVRANFAEMRFLEKSIGPTGRIAILPFMKTSSRDLWQLCMLEE